MPYRHHAGLKQPARNARIWRYMRQCWFLDLVHSRRLYLCRSDRFPDRREGVLADQQKSGLSPDERAHQDARHAHRRADYCVTCWQLSQDESAHMWARYAGAGDGVAIQSTCGRLIDAFDAWPYADCYFGQVQYGHDGWDIHRMDSDIRALMCKGAEFAHEREVRGMVRQNGAGGYYPEIYTGGPACSSPAVPDSSLEGYRIDVDLQSLLTGIVVSPTAPEGSTEALSAMLSRLGYAIPVASSTLRADSLRRALCVRSRS